MPWAPSQVLRGVRRGCGTCWHPAHAVLWDLVPFLPLWSMESGPWAPFLAGLDGLWRHATRCLRPPKKGEKA